jgi:hypothetical protein
METNITWLWLTTVLFAHAFAAFWLIKTLLLHDPQALSCFWRRKKHVSNSVIKARALQKAQEAAIGATATGADVVVLHLPKGSASKADVLGGYESRSHDLYCEG